MGEIQTPDWRDLGVSKEDLIAYELSMETQQHRPTLESIGPTRVINTFSLPESYDTTWFRKGVCRGLDPNLFMPVRGNQLTGETAMLRACGNCAVKAQCLDYALNIFPDAVGVWGGTTENERRKMRKVRKAA